MINYDLLRRARDILGDSSFHVSDFHCWHYQHFRGATVQVPTDAAEEISEADYEHVRSFTKKIFLLSHMGMKVPPQDMKILKDLGIRAYGQNIAEYESLMTVSHRFEDLFETFAPFSSNLFDRKKMTDLRDTLAKYQHASDVSPAVKRFTIEVDNLLNESAWNRLNTVQKVTFIKAFLGYFLQFNKSGMKSANEKFANRYINNVAKRLRVFENCCVDRELIPKGAFVDVTTEQAKLLDLMHAGLNVAACVLDENMVFTSKWFQYYYTNNIPLLEYSDIDIEIHSKEELQYLLKFADFFYVNHFYDECHRDVVLCNFIFGIHDAFLIDSFRRLLRRGFKLHFKNLTLNSCKDIVFLDELGIPTEEIFKDDLTIIDKDVSNDELIDYVINNQKHFRVASKSLLLLLAERVDNLASYSIKHEHFRRLTGEHRYNIIIRHPDVFVISTRKLLMKVIKETATLSPYQIDKDLSLAGYSIDKLTIVNPADIHRYLKLKLSMSELEFDCDISGEDFSPYLISEILLDAFLRSGVLPSKLHGENRAHLKQGYRIYRETQLLDLLVHEPLVAAEVSVENIRIQDPQVVALLLEQQCFSSQYVIADDFDYSTISERCPLHMQLDPMDLSARNLVACLMNKEQFHARYKALLLSEDCKKPLRTLTMRELTGVVSALKFVGDLLDVEQDLVNGQLGLQFFNRTFLRLQQTVRSQFYSADLENYLRFYRLATYFELPAFSQQGAQQRAQGEQLIRLLRRIIQSADPTLPLLSKDMHLIYEALHNSDYFGFCKNDSQAPSALQMLVFALGYQLEVYGFHDLQISKVGLRETAATGNAIAEYTFDQLCLLPVKTENGRFCFRVYSHDEILDSGLSDYAIFNNPETLKKLSKEQVDKLLCSESLVQSIVELEARNIQEKSHLPAPETRKRIRALGDHLNQNNSHRGRFNEATANEAVSALFNYLNRDDMTKRDLVYLDESYFVVSGRSEKTNFSMLFSHASHGGCTALMSTAILSWIDQYEAKVVKPAETKQKSAYSPYIQRSKKIADKDKILYANSKAAGEKMVAGLHNSPTRREMS